MKLVKIKYLLLASVCVAHVSAMEPSNGNDLGRKRSLTFTSGVSTIESFDSLDNSTNEKKHNSVKFFKKSKTKNKGVTFNPNVNVQKSKTFVETVPEMNEFNKLLKSSTTVKKVNKLVSAMNKEAINIKKVIGSIVGLKNMNVSDFNLNTDFIFNCINEPNHIDILDLDAAQVLERIKNHNKETFSHTIR